MDTLDLSVKDLLEAGAHFGHQKRRWNPKMKRFILEERSGLYIIDLAKTLNQIRLGAPVIKKIVESHKSVLFVGTKKQAKSTIEELAKACGEFYVCERWLGGMLTNITTIRQSIKTLEKIEKHLSNTEVDLTKKERSLLTKKHQKLNKNLAGVRFMKSLPGLLIVVDPSYEKIAVAEANTLGIPVMALVDTNCDPAPISHVIPCNDDSLKSIKIVASTLADMIISVKEQAKIEIKSYDVDNSFIHSSDEPVSATKALLNMKYSEQESQETNNV